MARNYFRVVSFFILTLFLQINYSAAQQSNISCGARVRLVNGSTPAFTVTQANAASPTPFNVLGVLVGGFWSNPGNLIDNDFNNFASGSITSTSGGSLVISASDAVNDYNAGNFAGFVLRSGGLINLSLLNDITVTTYLNGSFQESSSAGNLISVASSLTSGASEVGFYTNLPFDKIELNITTNSITLANYDVYYPVIRGYGSCTSPALVCNTNTAITFPTFPAVIDPVNTGTTGLVAVAAISNTDNAVDNDPASYASISTVASAAGSATIAVKDAVTNYPAGTYAGFDIDNAALLSTGLIGSITLRTYLNGTFVESKSGTGLLLGASVLGQGSRQKVGFVTGQPFDEVQLVLNQSAATVSLGTTRVYSAILKKFCAGPALACRTPVVLDESIYPVYINLERTGLSGAACPLCTVDSTGNVIDGNASTAATISLTSGALTGGSISVKDALTHYAIGTFAGFDIENAALLDVNVLNNIFITTYNSGSVQDVFTGASLLAGVTTNLFGATGRMTLGNVTTKVFDEIRITAVQTAGVNLGITKVYSPVLTNFCSGTIACNSSYLLNSTDFPVYIDARRTGATGAACALCNLSNVNNVITPSTTDFAQIVTAVSALSATSIAVRDAVSVYPAGVTTGFAIQNTNNILQANLFKRITVRTYLNGTVQESKSGTDLLNLSALILFINPGTGYYNVGFQTTLPFDEVQISADAVVGVIPVLNVYSAFVDTRSVDAVTAGILCPKPPVAEPDHTATLVNLPVSGSVRTNDHDPRGTALTYNTSATIPPANGAVTINADGTFVYTPATNFIGVDSFKYTVCNAASLCVDQWAYISVYPPRTPGGTNRTPAAQNDFSQTKVNVPVGGNARSNDGDADGHTLTYTTLTNPAHGTLTLNPNGNYVYTPDSSYVGTDTAKLQVCDNGTPSLCATSLLMLEVTPDANGPANDPPFAQDDVTTTPLNTTVTGNVLTNDSDPNGDPITATLLDTPPAAKGTISFAPNGGYSFIPALNYTGTFSVRYKVCDPSPDACDTATLTITVQPVTGPDFTPLIIFDSTIFRQTGAARDFVLNVSEVLGASSTGQVVVKILKPSAFTITYGANTTTAMVNNGTAVQNGDWTITQNTIFITCTLKSTASISASGNSNIGFNIARKANVPTSTMQNITATIVSGSGGDSNNSNNQTTENLNAQ